MRVSSVDKPFISICIPTFNRSDKVYELVTNILKYEGNEIEVIVLDNCSTDNTSDLLAEINDPRFIFIQNDTNIGGPMNHLKVITLGRGKFAVFCLDKDGLNYQGIEKLIRVMKSDPDVVFGYCGLNLSDEKPGSIYEKGFSSVLNMAYRSQHPTGMFYDVEIYRNLPVLAELLAKKEKFGFYPDLMNAEMAMYGKSQIINLPAFYTETKDDCKDTPSFTYTGKDAFFSPANRLIEFNRYLDSVQQLGLSNGELSKVVKRLYNNGLMTSTFGYRDIMIDHHVCSHYEVNARKVGTVELWKLNFNFSLFFLRKKLKMNFFAKVFVVFYANVKFLYSSVLS